MSSSFPAFRQYMVHLYATDIHGVAQPYILRPFLALSDSMPDPATARWPIPILSTEQCSAPSQLSNGVRYVPVRWIFIGLTHLVLLDSTPDSTTTRCPIPILSTGQCSAPSQPSNGVRYVSVRWIFIGLTHLVLLDSMPDSSTTRRPIPILSTG